MADWQGKLALAVVLVTAGLFIWRALRPKAPGCQEGCGCTPLKKDSRSDKD